MYNNIGGKIKILAQATMWIGIICSLIGGIALIVIGSDGYNRGEFIISGILVLVFGSLFSWVSSLVTYGIGQAVENTDRMVGNYQEPKENLIRDDVLRKLRAEGLISNNEYIGAKKND